ncbi:hypothetical protein BKA83DRAFT_4309817 [Pisolithus microcarpus]|nr:hypothetical protein BKA83DRAFT_4309817 [Pisolithus microcarpus]
MRFRAVGLAECCGVVVRLTTASMEVTLASMMIRKGFVSCAFEGESRQHNGHTGRCAMERVEGYTESLFTATYQCQMLSCSGQCDCEHWSMSPGPV